MSILGYDLLLNKKSPLLKISDSKRSPPTVSAINTPFNDINCGSSLIMSSTGIIKVNILEILSSSLIRKEVNSYFLSSAGIKTHNFFAIIL
jgi:hypothetical protein